MSTTIAIFSFFLVITVIFFLQEATRNSRVKYKLSDSKLEVINGFLAWVTVPYGKITEVREAVLWEKFIGLLTGTQDHLLGRGILLVYQKNGKLKEVAIAPSKPDEFAEELKQRMTRASSLPENIKVSVEQEAKKEQKKTHFLLFLGLVVMIAISLLINPLMRQILDWMP